MPKQDDETPHQRLVSTLQRLLREGKITEEQQRYTLEDYEELMKLYKTLEELNKDPVKNKGRISEESETIETYINNIKKLTGIDFSTIANSDLSELHSDVKPLVVAAASAPSSFLPSLPRLLPPSANNVTTYTHGKEYKLRDFVKYNRSFYMYNSKIPNNKSSPEPIIVSSGEISPWTLIREPAKILELEEALDRNEPMSPRSESPHSESQSALPRALASAVPLSDVHRLASAVPSAPAAVPKPGRVAFGNFAIKKPEEQADYPNWSPMAQYRQGDIVSSGGKQYRYIGKDGTGEMPGNSVKASWAVADYLGRVDPWVEGTPYKFGTVVNHKGTNYKYINNREGVIEEPGINLKSWERV